MWTLFALFFVKKTITWINKGRKEEKGKEETKDLNCEINFGKNLRYENWALWGVKEFQEGFVKIEKIKNAGTIGKIMEKGK